MEYSEKLYTGALTNPLHPYFCGRRLNAYNHRFGPTERPHFWMIYLKEGAGTFTMNGHTHRLTKGDLFIAFPHRIIKYCSDSNNMWNIYWLAIDENGALPFLNMLGVTEDSPIVHANSAFSAERTFEALFEMFSNNSISDNLMCMGLILQLFSHFTSKESATTAYRDHIDEALLFLSSHSTEPITVADCARAIGLAPAYLSRLFRFHIGVTPTGWLSARRLENASVMLKETKLTISEISQAVGIKDPLYFSRCFSRKFGCSPKEYRKRQS